METEFDTARATPEGRLWMAVLHGAFRDLERIGEWLVSHVPLRGEPSGPRGTPLGLSRQPTRDQIKRQINAAADLMTFFEDDGSMMCVLCDALGYEPEVVRELARRMMSDARLAERIARAHQIVRGRALRSAARELLPEASSRVA